MPRTLLMTSLFLAVSIARADVVWCDPHTGTCHRSDSLETLLIPSNHCVLITEIDGEPVNAIACNRERRAAPADLSPGNSLSLPQPWRVFPALQQPAQALALPVPDIKPGSNSAGRELRLREAGKID